MAKKNLSQPASVSPQKPAEKTQAISEKALKEIRSLYWSLDAVMAITFTAPDADPEQIILAIRPAVERLGAIIEQNHFPE